VTLLPAAAALALIVTVLTIHRRRRVLLACLLVVASAPVLILAVVFTGEVASDLLVRGARILVATVVLSVVTVLLVGRGLPQLVSRRDRHGVAVVCGALSVMYAAVAVFLAVVAGEGTRAADLPVLRDRADFIAWRDGPHHPGGVLLAGTISELTPEVDPPHGVVASHSCLAVGSRRFPMPGSRLPHRYVVDFPGGPPVVVEGIDSGIQAWNWPSGAGKCVLRRGDRVVVWGDLRGGLGGGTTSYTGVADVRIVAAGDVTTFLQVYVPAAERTGRAVLAWAVLNGALAVTIAVIGVLCYRRLARTGTDAPPRITWHTGPR
jgi:hypothetical protein